MLTSYNIRALLQSFCSSDTRKNDSRLFSEVGCRHLFFAFAFFYQDLSLPLQRGQMLWL